MERADQIIVTALACVGLVTMALGAPKPRTKAVVYAASQGTTSGNSAVYQVTSRGVTVLVEDIGQPQKMALDETGTLFITDIAGDNGDLIWRLPSGGAIEPHYVFPGNSFASPYGIALGSAGSIYVTGSPGDRTYSTSIFEIDSQGDANSLATTDGAIYALTRSAAGELFAAGNYFSLNRVYEVVGGNFLTLIDGLPDLPRDVQLGPDNAIYVAVESTNRIYRWDRSDPSPVLAAYADVTRPLSLTFDEAGYLYVGQGNGSVSRVDPQGDASLIATGFRGDPITGIAVQCPQSRGKGTPKPCFNVAALVTGP